MKADFNIREKEKIAVLIEPIIKKKWLPKIVTRLITKNDLVSYTLEVNKIAFKVLIKNGKSIPDKIILKNFSLQGKRSIASWDSQIELRSSEIMNGTETRKTLKVVFPYTDLFMLQTSVFAEPDNFIIETKQRRLTGEEGRGWFNKEHKNICRMPIGAIDILNFRLIFYTVCILFLTVVLAGITLWQIIN